MYSIRYTMKIVRLDTSISFIAKHSKYSVTTASLRECEKAHKCHTYVVCMFKLKNGCNAICSSTLLQGIDFHIYILKFNLLENIGVNMFVWINGP